MITMSDRETTFTEDEFHYEEPPKMSKATMTLIGFGLVMVAIVIGAITITGFNVDTWITDKEFPYIYEPQLGEIIDYEDNPIITEDTELVTLIVTDQKPSALSHREFDYVDVHMDHLQPDITDIQRTLHWAKEANMMDNCVMDHLSTRGGNYTMEIQQIENFCNLTYIEEEILQGAKENDFKITFGEQIMLEIITWAKHPEICSSDPPSNPNCEFFDINYNEDLYQTGEITRDQYWLNIKKYANQTTIDQVEGRQGT